MKPRRTRDPAAPAEPPKAQRSPDELTYVQREGAPQKSHARQATESERLRIAFQLTLRGETATHVAEVLGLRRDQAVRIIDASLRDHRNRTARQMRRAFATQVARYEEVIGTIQPLALGSKNADGKTTTAPNLKWCRALQVTYRQLDKLYGFDRQIQQHRVEHVGDGGGPILTRDLSRLSDAQLDAIVAAKPEDVPRLLEGSSGSRDGDPPPEGGPVH